MLLNASARPLGAQKVIDLLLGIDFHFGINGGEGLAFCEVFGNYFEVCRPVVVFGSDLYCEPTNPGA